MINIVKTPSTSAAAQDAQKRLVIALLSSVKRMRVEDLERIERQVGSMDDVADRMLKSLPVPDPVDEILGPFRTTESVRQLVGVRTRQAVQARVEAGTLLAVMTSDGKRLFPDFQFDDRGQSLPRLNQVLEAFGGSKDAWDAALWLAQPEQDLGGQTPAEALRGDNAGFVVELARRAGSVLAS
ncbi:antitoxin Xre/MbcA/ParS toxin-binding domain-containing protein [Curtobacterium flaccumfaciens]|uniref:antitoxin Xre/MbcA/ParS toxin-binding domain-containing protein n=1 Tax=Curtobacterium flaccumfaciens TaxID=2035 RepID=UPI001E29169F|nr:antitoxin Xre/MbcA/ParS toxin-binding domain-containing protein [Curtobacterium allii]MCE0459630.1 DUF2384 domain-containing protein [Curtobacterium allii]